MLPEFDAKEFLTPFEVRWHNELVVEIHRHERQIAELRAQLAKVRGRARVRKHRAQSAS